MLSLPIHTYVLQCISFCNVAHLRPVGTSVLLHIFYLFQQKLLLHNTTSGGGKEGESKCQISHFRNTSCMDLLVAFRVLPYLPSNLLLQLLRTLVLLSLYHFILTLNNVVHNFPPKLTMPLGYNGFKQLHNITEKVFGQAVCSFTSADTMWLKRNVHYSFARGTHRRRQKMELSESFH